MKLYILQIGDSKVRGLAATKDRLGQPVIVGPAYYGGGYTAGFTIALSGVTDGVNGVYNAAIMDVTSYPTNGKGLALFPSNPGTGYVDDTKKPIITISGGAPTTAATYASIYAGGTSSGLQAGLVSAGYDVEVINLGMDGSAIADITPPGSSTAQALVAAIAFFGAANCLVTISTGVNNAVSTTDNAQSTFQSSLTGLVNFCTAQGVKALINKTCWIEQPTLASYTETQRTNANGFLDQYATAIDTTANANPSVLKVITDEHAILSTAPATYFTGAQGLHQNDAGYNALVTDMLPKYKTFITANYPSAVTSAPVTDPYKSDYTNAAFVEVNFKPNPPGSFTATGLGTALRPEGDLIYTVPANMQGGRIVFERRLHGTADPWVAIGKVDGPDANTPPAATYQDLTVLNSITYEWRAYALPKGDFNPAVFP